MISLGRDEDGDHLQASSKIAWRNTRSVARSRSPLWYFFECNSIDIHRYRNACRACKRQRRKKERRKKNKKRKEDRTRLVRCRSRQSGTREMQNDERRGVAGREEGVFSKRIAEQGKTRKKWESPPPPSPPPTPDATGEKRAKRRNLSWYLVDRIVAVFPRDPRRRPGFFTEICAARESSIDFRSVTAGYRAPNESTWNWRICRLSNAHCYMLE